MQKRKVWKKIGVFVLLLALCTGMIPVQAENVDETDAYAVQPRWSVLRTCIMDCTISDNGIASIYTNALTKQTGQKVKVTAYLTEFDPYTNTYKDYCSISDTGYGNTWVTREYMVPSNPGIYMNKSVIKCYNTDGTLAETLTLYTEDYYYPGR